MQRTERGSALRHHEKQVGKHPKISLCASRRGSGAPHPRDGGAVGGRAELRRRGLYRMGLRNGVPHSLRALLHRSGALRHLGARSHRLYAQGVVRPLAGSAPRLPLHALGRGRGRGQSRRNRRDIRGNRREEELFRHLQAQVSHFAECRLCPFGGRGHLRGRLRRNGQPQRGQVGGSPQRLSHLPRLVRGERTHPSAVQPQRDLFHRDRRPGQEDRGAL